MVFLCLLSTYLTQQATAEEAKKADSKVYFTLGNQHEFPLTDEREVFGCSDKIFTVVELDHLPKATYQLSIAWIDPSDTERERSEYPFSVTLDQTRLWSWLSLSRATGAGLIQWIDPAAGLEEFIGEWTVEVRINNKKISTKNFEVVC